MALETFAVQDLLPLKHRKKWDLKLLIPLVLPFALLPLLLLIAANSLTSTIIVMVFIAMGFLYVQSSLQASRSRFFFCWTLSSSLIFFLVFEFSIVLMLEVTIYENAVELILMALTAYCFYKTKNIADFELAMGSCKGKEYSPVLTSDSHFCPVCQLEVNERFFHSIWWDCCIFRPNYLYYLLGLIFGNAALLYGTNLGLTTVCLPTIFIYTILLPKDCSDAYYEIEQAFCFVSCIYGIGFLLIGMFFLIQQFCRYLPRYYSQKRKYLNSKKGTTEHLSV